MAAETKIVLIIISVITENRIYRNTEIGFPFWNYLNGINILCQILANIFYSEAKNLMGES